MDRHAQDTGMKQLLPLQHRLYHVSQIEIYEHFTLHLFYFIRSNIRPVKPY